MEHAAMQQNSSDNFAEGTSSSDQQVNRAEQQIRSCANQMVQQIRSLRELQDIADDTEISVYVTDTPIVHSTLETYREEIEELTRTVDFVQVNVDAGNPLPEHLPYKEITIGDQVINVAIDEAENAED